MVEILKGTVTGPLLQIRVPCRGSKHADKQRGEDAAEKIFRRHVVDEPHEFKAPEVGRVQQLREDDREDLGKEINIVADIFRGAPSLRPAKGYLISKAEGGK